YGVALVLKIMNVQFVSQLERAGGALIGLCRGVLIGGLVLVALSLFPIDYFQSSISEKSLLSPYLIKSTTTTYAFIMRFLPKQESKKSDIKSSAKQVKQSKKAVK
ncbi:MAG: CvpA family protein, partial [Candidatus Omnitrophica bacterium]|nr:CvpA family protein [Candidatus Omnitrophota bacterium]